jgi:hypothetical protein
MRIPLRDRPLARTLRRLPNPSDLATPDAIGPTLGIKFNAWLTIPLFLMKGRADLNISNSPRPRRVRRLLPPSSIVMPPVRLRRTRLRRTPTPRRLRPSPMDPMMSERIPRPTRRTRFLRRPRPDISDESEYLLITIVIYIYTLYKNSNVV